MQLRFGAFNGKRAVERASFNAHLEIYALDSTTAPLDGEQEHDSDTTQHPSSGYSPPVHVAFCYWNVFGCLNFLLHHYYTSSFCIIMKY
jgi:hypothetical protein